MSGGKLMKLFYLMLWMLEVVLGAQGQIAVQEAPGLLASSQTKTQVILVIRQTLQTA